MATYIFYAEWRAPNLWCLQGAAGRVNCFDHCIVVVLSREDMAATYSKVVGRMVYTRADFRSWIRKNEAVLNGMGMLLNKAVYKEVYRALSERRHDLVAIVPQFDLDDADRLITEFFDLCNASEHTTTRVRQLFEGVTVMLSNSVDPVEPPVTENSRDSVDESRMELLSLHLERIITKAAVEDDQTLREHAGTG